MALFETPSGWKLHYHTYGNGPQKVLLIMGFACCKSYWHPQVDLLLELGKIAPSSSSSSSSDSSSLLQRYTIVLGDSRGFGKSSDTFANRYSTYNMARDFYALLLHMGWIGEQSTPHAPPPLLHIAGWSMGGMIAQELCLLLAKPPIAHANSLASMTFVSTTPGGVTDVWRMPLLRNLPPFAGMMIIVRTVLGSFTTSQRIRQSMRLHFSDSFLRRVILAQDQHQHDGSSGHSPANEETKAPDSASASSSSASSLPLPLALATPPLTLTPQTGSDLMYRAYISRSPFDRPPHHYWWGFFGHVWAVFSHHVSPERLAYLRQKECGARSLVVVGGKDCLVSPHNSAVLADELRCEMVTFPESGHMVHTEYPIEFARTLHEHFQLGAADFLASLPLPSPLSSSSSTPCFDPSVYASVSDVSSLSKQSVFYKKQRNSTEEEAVEEEEVRAMTKEEIECLSRLKPRVRSHSKAHASNSSSSSSSSSTASSSAPSSASSASSSPSFAKRAIDILKVSASSPCLSSASSAISDSDSDSPASSSSSLRPPPCPPAPSPSSSLQLLLRLSSYIAPSSQPITSTHTHTTATALDQVALSRLSSTPRDKTFKLNRYTLRWLSFIGVLGVIYRSYVLVFQPSLMRVSVFVALLKRWLVYVIRAGRLSLSTVCRLLISLLPRMKGMVTMAAETASSAILSA